jgi:hypothetical protein
MASYHIETSHRRLLHYLLINQDDWIHDDRWKLTPQHPELRCFTANLWFLYVTQSLCEIAREGISAASQMTRPPNPPEVFPNGQSRDLR